MPPNPLWAEASLVSSGHQPSRAPGPLTTRGSTRGSPSSTSVCLCPHAPREGRSGLGLPPRSTPPSSTTTGSQHTWPCALRPWAEGPVSPSHSCLGADPGCGRHRGARLGAGRRAHTGPAGCTSVPRRPASPLQFSVFLFATRWEGSSGSSARLGDRPGPAGSGQRPSHLTEASGSAGGRPLAVGPIVRAPLGPAPEPGFRVQSVPGCLLWSSGRGLPAAGPGWAAHPRERAFVPPEGRRRGKGGPVATARCWEAPGGRLRPRPRRGSPSLLPPRRACGAQGLRAFPLHPRTQPHPDGALSGSPVWP